jgi:hypothetical protein
MTLSSAADPRALRALLGVCAALFAAPVPFVFPDAPLVAIVLGVTALAHGVVLVWARGEGLPRAALAAQILGMVTLPLLLLGVALPSLL